MGYKYGRSCDETMVGSPLADLHEERLVGGGEVGQEVDVQRSAQVVRVRHKHVLDTLRQKLCSQQKRSRSGRNDWNHTLRDSGTRESHSITGKAVFKLPPSDGLPSLDWSIHRRILSLGNVLDRSTGTSRHLPFNRSYNTLQQPPQGIRSSTNWRVPTSDDSLRIPWISP